MGGYRDLSIRKKLQGIVMVTSAAALLVASVVFTLYDRSTFLFAKTQDLRASAQMVGSNSTAALRPTVTVPWMGSCRIRMTPTT